MQKSTAEGQAPGEYWQIDFTGLPRKGGLKYLLVLVDTYAGWPEAFQCRTSKAGGVQALLNNSEIWGTSGNIIRQRSTIYSQGSY